MSHVNTKQILGVPVALLRGDKSKRIRMAEKCEVGERESSVQYGGSVVYWVRRE